MARWVPYTSTATHLPSGSTLTTGRWKECSSPPYKYVGCVCVECEVCMCVMCVMVCVMCVMVSV